MKLLSLFVVVVTFAVTVNVIAQETVNPGGLATIRGASNIDETRPADKLKRVIKDKNPIARNYVHQPPVVLSLIHI